MESKRSGLAPELTFETLREMCIPIKEIERWSL